MNLILFISMLAIIDIVSLTVFFHKYPTIFHYRAFSYILFSIIEGIVLKVFLYCKMYNLYWLLLPFNYFLVFGSPPVFLRIIDNFLNLKKNQVKLIFYVQFIPAVVSFFYFKIFIYTSYNKLHFISQMNMGEKPFSLLMLDIAFIIQTSIYMGIIYNRVSEHYKNNPKDIKARVLMKFIVFFIVVAVLLFCGNFMISTLPLLFMTGLPISSILFYNFFLYMAIKHPLYLLDTSTKQVLPSNSKFITEEKKENISNKIQSLINQDKVYLESNINISSFAQRSNTPKYLLIQYLNQHYGKSFPEFINEFRVKDAKKLLTGPEYQKYSIEVIGKMCGFSTRSSFYSVFKKNTGMSPAQYIKNENINIKTIRTQ